MGRALLFRLMRDLHVGLVRAGNLRHRLGTVAGDHHHAVGCQHRAGAQRVGQQRRTAQRVQDLGPLGVHAAAKAGGEKDKRNGHQGFL